MRGRKMKNGEEYGIERNRGELMSKLKRERVGKIGEEREKKRREENRGGKYTYLSLYAISVFFLRIYAFIFISLFLPIPHTPLLPLPFFISFFYPTPTLLSLCPPLSLSLSLDKDSIFFSPYF